jgi:hypothetical protein
LPAPDPNKIEPEELDGEMRPADIVEILRGLHFGRGYRHCDGTNGKLNSISSLPQLVATSKPWSKTACLLQ